jgi:O-antigen ligase
VIRELSGLPAGRIVLYVKRFSYLLIIPGILLLLHVPGFEPRVPGKHTAGGYLTYYTRLSHPVLGGSNNLATLLAFFVPILAYWGLSRHDRRATTAAFIATIAIFLTLSRGVLLAFLIAALLYAPLASRRLPARRSNLVPKIISAVAAGAVAIAIFTSIDPTAHQLFATRLSAANVESRTELISISLQKIALRPLLGYGGGVNPQLDPLSAYRADTGHTSALAVAPAQASSLSGTELDTHNAYLQQVIYFGLPLGLAMTLALWATVGVFVANRHAQALAGVIGYTILVQLVSFLFEASFEGTVLRVLFYMSIGLAVALLRSVEREETVTGEAAS